MESLWSRGVIADEFAALGATVKGFPLKISFAMPVKLWERHFTEGCGFPQVFWLRSSLFLVIFRDHRCIPVEVVGVDSLYPRPAYL